MSEEGQSPCVRQCTLDHDGRCLGCGRHIDTITRWSDMTQVQRAAAMQEAAEHLSNRGRG